MSVGLKDIIICPKQPYFVMTTSHYYKAVVMNYGISHFYCFQKEDTIKNSFIAVPDGCIDILFCCDDNDPYAHVCGTVLRPTLTHNNQNKYFFGVRFLPGSPFKFKNITMSDLVEQEIPFLEVMEDRELFEKITTSRDFNYQIQVFLERYIKLYVNLEEINKYKDLKKYIMNNIMQTAGKIKINELAEATGYSVRYINKTFSQEFGLSPKVFCKLMRFQYLLSILNDFDKDISDSNLAQISTDLGYYDQSHMIKDFYEFTNKTPSKYIHSLQEIEYKKRIVII
ncbi:MULTISPECIES: helix-turn-helix domain-containing protein [unclassified Clostridium]|uniref:helix-turn-helix domain-containing protein n=1 Tax=unclassified Clostridium TaxID=2614128 RepID=UPI00029784C8|nr:MULTISPECIES: helix-turn-helix domain-containing protein [unclassified Clostridium]EKQ55570.1 MAG: DNA-binding domain-containing protein, AraC-type [Clostridium sp. Maddingley MBC34-26]